MSGQSLVPVETAVPAFVGYTETASNNGQSVSLVPTRISALAEYESIYGGAPKYRFALRPLAVAVGPSVVTIAGKPYELALEGDLCFYNSLRLFFANGGGVCYIVSVGSYDDAVGGKPSADALKKGLDALRDLVGPTMLAIPEAAKLDRPACAALAGAMLAQCADRQDRFAILDVWGIDGLPLHVAPSEFAAAIAAFRGDIGGLNSAGLGFGAAYAPFLSTSIVSVSEVSLLNLDSQSQAILQAIPPSDPVFAQIYAEMAARLGTLPPSAAMPGVYTANDGARYVWTAPANVALSAVVAPGVVISDAMQGDLNAPIDGLAVDAIRFFPGRGTLVWGARTLDANSQDGRYINFRRTLIFIEQTVKRGLQQYAFASNDAPTWTSAISAVDDFLKWTWQAGGLIGSTPQQAFWVKCSFGTTMTPQDIQDGRLIVQIGMAMIHPAEFTLVVITQMVQPAN